MTVAGWHCSLAAGRRSMSSQGNWGHHLKAQTQEIIAFVAAYKKLTLLLHLKLKSFCLCNKVSLL